MKHEEDGKKILEEFSKNLEEIPDSAEMVYDTEQSNVLRDDDKPVKKDVYDRVMENAPNKDKQGYIIAERMKL